MIVYFGNLLIGEEFILSDRLYKKINDNQAEVVINSWFDNLNHGIKNGEIYYVAIMMKVKKYL